MLPNQRKASEKLRTPLSDTVLDEFNGPRSKEELFELIEHESCDTNEVAADPHTRDIREMKSNGKIRFVLRMQREEKFSNRALVRSCGGYAYTRW